MQLQFWSFSEFTPHNIWGEGICQTNPCQFVLVHDKDQFSTGAPGRGMGTTCLLMVFEKGKRFVRQSCIPKRTKWFKRPLFLP